MKRLLFCIAILSIVFPLTACADQKPAENQAQQQVQKPPTLQDLQNMLVAHQIRGKALMDSQAQVQNLIRENDVIASKIQEQIEAMKQAPAKVDPAPKVAESVKGEAKPKAAKDGK